MARYRKINLKNVNADSRALLKRVRLSVAEIVALVTLGLFCAFVLYFHFSKVHPKTAELDDLAARETLALDRIRRANDDKRKFETEKSNSGRIIGSLEAFERLLKDREEGTSQIINEVNRLAQMTDAEAVDFAYRLVVSESGDEKSPSGAAQREDKLNVFTALGIGTTAIGSYSNLRRLIESIERSSQFIIIDSIAFQGEADSAGRAITSSAAPGPAPIQGVPAPAVPVQARVPSPVQRGAAGGANEIQVSLKIDMETYFRRRD